MAHAQKIGLLPVCDTCGYSMWIDNSNSSSALNRTGTPCECRTYNCAEKGIRYWIPIERIGLKRIEQGEEEA